MRQVTLAVWAVALGTMAACTGVTPVARSSRPAALPTADTFKVISVIDGQTIGVDCGGQELAVRLLGLQAGTLAMPGRVYDRHRPAMQYLRETLTDRRVRLEFPPNGPRVADGRALAYVMAIDGSSSASVGQRERFVNADMIRLGYAIPDGSTPHPYAAYFDLQLRLAQQRTQQRAADPSSRPLAEPPADRPSEPVPFPPQRNRFAADEQP